MARAAWKTGRKEVLGRCVSGLGMVLLAGCSSTHGFNAFQSRPAPSAEPSSTLAPNGAPTDAASACRSGNPLAHVYSPQRLLVHNRCMTVRGVVMSVKRELDLDLHVNLRVDAQFGDLINDRNRQREHGGLVLEIVPADQSVCVFNQGHSTTYSLCTGADLATPKVGDHISVSGPYVTDLVHGWNEIHPVWGWHST